MAENSAECNDSVNIQKIDLCFRMKAIEGGVKPDPNSLSLLKHLGFEVGEILGSGEYAKIRKARWAKENKDVAIKIIPKFKAPQIYYEKALPREINALQQTQSHPLIIDLFAVYDGPRAYYLIQEYLPMGDMLDYVNERRFLGEGESRKFFKQLVEAVEYCHSHGIFHRDVKLDNILLDSQFNIRLCDFGFAAVEAKDKLLSTHCGSMLYAAPEIYMHKSYDGAKADIWSIGICLYAMLCGKLPYSLPDPDVFIRAVEKEVVFIRPLSRNCRRLIRNILTVDPSRRLLVHEIRKSPWFVQEIDIFSAEEFASESSLTSLAVQKNEKGHLDPNAEHDFAADYRVARKTEIKARFVSGVLKALASQKSQGQSKEDILKKDPLMCIGVVGDAGRAISQELIRFGYYGERSTVQAYSTGMVEMPAADVLRKMQEKRRKEVRRELRLLRFCVGGRMARAARLMATQEKGKSTFGENLRFKAAVLRVQREKLERWRDVCKQMLACAATVKHQMHGQIENGENQEPENVWKLVLERSKQ